MKIPNNLREPNWDNFEEKPQKIIQKYYERSLEEAFYKVNGEKPGPMPMVRLMIDTRILEDSSTMEFVFWHIDSGHAIGRVDRNVIYSEEIPKT